MILSVWKPNYSKGVIINYELVDNNTLSLKKGITAYKVIWLCDDKNCKTPSKKHSISACHLIKQKMNKNLQICRNCQCSGSGNGRFGDNRKWEDILGNERSNKLKQKYSEKFKGEKNPSKSDDVKSKKGQTIINQETLKTKIIEKNFELIEIIKLDGKKTSFIVKCNNNHLSKKIYSNFFNKNRKFICPKCFYASIGFDLSDEEIKNFQKYSKIVRLLTRKEYRKNKQIINPNNFKINNEDFHIDHRFSIYEGFKFNIEPQVISFHGNLQVISAKENLQKGIKSSISINELFDIYNQTKNK